MSSLVQIRQPNKFGSARNDEIINLNLGSGTDLEPATSAACKTSFTFIDSIHPHNQP